MAIRPAGRMDGLGFNAFRFTGNLGLTRYVPLAGSRFNPNTGETYARTSAQPDGYSAGGAYTLPIVAGGMSSWQPNSITFDATGDMLQGGPMEGAGAISFTGEGDASLVISMTGTGALSIAGAGGLALTIGLDGSGGLTVSGTGALALIVPFEGTGGFTLAGAADLKGRLALAGEWTPFTELSPEGLAAAVWGAVAASNNQAGTMGAKVNAAGAAADPWSVTLEGTYTAADLLRIAAAVLAGDATGTNQPGTTVFKSLDGTKDRVTATQTEGARTITARDAS